MNRVFLYRGTSVPPGYADGNPLLIKNFQVTNPLNGVFYALARSSSYDEEARTNAEGWASFHAKKLNQEALVVVLEVNEENFPALTGRIHMPLMVFGKRRVKPVLNFRELMNAPGRVRLLIMIVNAEGMSYEELEALNVKLGRVDAEGRAVYQDFIFPKMGIEGYYRPLFERKST